MYIGGTWSAASSKRWLDVINPTTEEVVSTVPAGDATDVDRAVDVAAEAAAEWNALGWQGRASIVRELAGRIWDAQEHLAGTDARDGGMAITGMRADVASTAASLHYYAGVAPDVRGLTMPASASQLAYTLQQPYGVVGRIIAFNHPFKFAATKIGAALVAGNAVVLKPSEHTSLSALEFASLTEGLLPPGVLNVVTGLGEDVGHAIAAHPRVPRVAFTGSVQTGRAVLRAGAEQIKHVTVELGGKNPLIVFPDVDPARAAKATIRAMNLTVCAGQSCGSTSRLLIHDDIRDAYLDALVAELDKLVVGDPTEDDTDLGPLAFRQHHQRVLAHIARAKADGATLVCGGGRPAGLDRGFFVAPTVFSGVTPEMAIAREEIFGPVMAVLGWRDWDEVVALANDTTFGLTGHVWTNDLAAAHRTAAAIEAGYISVNGTGRRPLGTPFGGWKTSGLGKENSVEEVFSYTQQKTVNVNLL
jgi:betaine-aldehyde dehydrogenase